MIKGLLRSARQWPVRAYRRIRRIRIRLVKGWNKAWRWLSMHFLMLIGGINAGWAMVPDDMRAAVDIRTLSWITIALALGGAIGRVIDQGGDDENAE